jgi:hypothetical protein
VFLDLAEPAYGALIAGLDAQCMAYAGLGSTRISRCGREQQPCLGVLWILPKHPGKQVPRAFAIPGAHAGDCFCQQGLGLLLS